ncbi:hypothetical protein [Haloferax sp. YSMS24]|uniref:hypothetical protein n=1 Tax=Haloferax sp. YSMS24 TaxID=3388425 RepID=UPI00398CDF65
MTGTGRSRWSRWFVVLSVAFLVCWRLGALVGIPRRAEVILALFGFVFHVVFGMAYLLIPSYFGTVLSTDRIPLVHLVLAVSGTVLLVLSAFAVGPPSLGMLGALLWSGGVAAFVSALFWSIRDELRRGETGTASHRQAFEWVDRYANRFVPVAFFYLVVGSYELLARSTTLPGLTDGYFPRITHLLAAGFVVLLVFTLGVRLAPRFLGVPAPRALTAVVLPAGAVGPGLVAIGLSSGPVFVAGAVAEAVAFVGFAALYLVVFLQSDRRRIGSESVLAGVLSGVAGVTIGLTVALGPLVGLPPFSAAAVQAHLQLNLLGFLGLVVVGFALMFFPPTAGRFRGSNERTARLTIAVLVAGVVVSVVGQFTGGSVVATVGDGVVLIGTFGYGYLLTRLLVEIGARRAG